TSSTTAELVAILAALESIKIITPPTKAVVLTDSRGALQQLQRLERATPLLKSVALTASTVEDLGWSLALQWIPSHVRIPGNERADELAARANNDGITPSPDFDPAARIPQSVFICTAARQNPDAQLVVILKTQPTPYFFVQPMRISEKFYCDPMLQLDFSTSLPNRF
ncbi:hypothetical protein HPB47_020219, partial [Ixodes persulcatus]